MFNVRCAKGTLAAALLCAASGAANALPTMSLLPATGDYLVGDIVTLTLRMDFSAPGDLTLGGGTDIMWDTSFLSLVSWDPIPFGDPGFARDGDISEGLIDGFAFGDFNGLAGPADVATISFELLAAGMTMVTMDDDSDGIAGPFVSATTFVAQTVDFQGAALNIGGAAIPLPAAAWLLIGGIGTLFGFRRRQAA